MAVTDMIASHRSRRGFSIIELLMVVAVGATLMALGTPVLRGAMANQRLRAGAADVGNALSEARREAFRTSTTARIEVDPADGRISVFAWDSVANAEAERKRYYLPAGVQFNNVGSRDLLHLRHARPARGPADVDSTAAREHDRRSARCPCSGPAGPPRRKESLS